MSKRTLYNGDDAMHGDLATDFNKAMQKTEDMRSRLVKIFQNYSSRPDLNDGYTFLDEGSGLQIQIYSRHDASAFRFNIWKDGNILGKFEILPGGAITGLLYHPGKGRKTITNRTGATHYFFHNNEIPRILDSHFRKVTGTRDASHAVEGNEDKVAGILRPNE